MLRSAQSIGEHIGVSAPPFSPREPPDAASSLLIVQGISAAGTASAGSTTQAMKTLIANALLQRYPQIAVIR